MRATEERLAGVSCVQGNVPLSLMHPGSRSDAAVCCRDLIESVGPGGGFILHVGAAIDEAKDENVRAAIETAKEHGAY
jgi:uroporphyrinogen-III decarboxylase